MKTMSLVFVLLCLCTLSFSEALNGGFSVEIIHRDSSKSPFYSSTETPFQRVANAMRRSLNCVNHFNQSRVPPNTPKTTVVPDQGEYLVKYSVGTPPFNAFGFLSTGTNLIWLQCQPCKKCFPQPTPLFDSSKSTTYRTFPCASNTCKSVSGTFCSHVPDKHCEYYINYMDGTLSQGELSEETLSLSSTNGNAIKFPGTLIGCGRYNTIGSLRANSGIVGLARGPGSLINQLGPSIGGKFSYCLVPALSKSNSTSKLNFGDAAVVSGAGTVSTPLFSRNGDPLYYLRLEALSVGGKRIQYGSAVGGSGNMAIDSGTILSVLPNDVYSKLEAAVARSVRMVRSRDPNKVLSLCYEGLVDKLDAPVITAHFTGADVPLDAVNTFVQVGYNVVCLAFVPSQNGPVLGNLAQQNILVGYDLQKNTVSFRKTDCTLQ